MTGMSRLWWKSSTAYPAVMGYFGSNTITCAVKEETTGTICDGGHSTEPTL